jgi:tRNA dimethylallyltransferase
LNNFQSPDSHWKFLMKPPLIIILGPTASGKSALAVALARRFKGEVVSADSRQIYRGLDIATGKITRRQMRGIPHHLLNISSPRRQISAAAYQQKANAAIHAIHQRGGLPFLVGGTGLYIDAVARGIQFPEVRPNPKLRRRLAKLSTGLLFKKLQQIDPARAARIDPSNPRRLIRAIEIAKALGRVPDIKKMPEYDTLLLGINLSPKKLKDNIKKRTQERLGRGMVQEARRLRKNGVTAKRLHELGLEYRILADFLEGKLEKSELSRKIEQADWEYAKRQGTWFRRYSDIHWVKNKNEAARAVRSFISSGKKRA